MPTTISVVMFSMPSFDFPILFTPFKGYFLDFAFSITFYFIFFVSPTYIHTYSNFVYVSIISYTFSIQIIYLMSDFFLLIHFWEILSFVFLAFFFLSDFSFFCYFLPIHFFQKMPSYH